MQDEKKKYIYQLAVCHSRQVDTSFRFVVIENSASHSTAVAYMTKGRWFNPWLGQCSFRRLMIVIATEFIPLSPLSIVSTMVMWESSQWLVKNIVRSTSLKELKESTGRCTGRHSITNTVENGV